MARRTERGSVIVVTLVVAALLAGGAALIAMQVSSSRAAGVSRAGLTGLYCAESGLAVARDLVAANYAGWNAVLCNPPPPRGTGACVIGSAAAEPIWLRSPAVNHDLDGDGVGDFVLTLVDNDDEVANDLSVDSDQQVYIVSTCIMNTGLRAQVSELVRYDTITHKLSKKLWVQTE